MRKNLSVIILTFLIIPLNINVIIIAPVSLIDDSGLGGVKEGKKGMTIMAYPHFVTYHGEHLLMYAGIQVKVRALMKNRYKRKKVP